MHVDFQSVDFRRIFFSLSNIDHWKCFFLFSHKIKKILVSKEFEKHFKYSQQVKMFEQTKFISIDKINQHLNQNIYLFIIHI